MSQVIIRPFEFTQFSDTNRTSNDEEKRLAPVIENIEVYVCLYTYTLLCRWSSDPDATTTYDVDVRGASIFDFKI